MFLGAKNIQCGKSDKAEWFHVRSDSLYINYFYEEPRGVFNNIYQTECTNRCQEQSEICAVVVEGDGDCSWYESSVSYSYKLLTTDSESTGMIKLCPEGKRFNT